MQVGSEIYAKLDNMTRRDLLFRGKEQYIAWGDVHQLNVRVMFSSEEHTLPKYLELRKADMRYEESPFAEIHFWLKLLMPKKQVLCTIRRLIVLPCPG